MREEGGLACVDRDGCKGERDALSPPVNMSPKTVPCIASIAGVLEDAIGVRGSVAHHGQHTLPSSGALEQTIQCRCHSLYTMIRPSYLM